MGINVGMRKLLVLMPKLIGFLSMMGSSYIVYSMMKTERDRRENMKSTFNRFLLLLSLFDIASSFGLFLSTWAVPKDSPGTMEAMVEEFGLTYDGEHFVYNDFFPWASGNRASCNFQGFLIHIGSVGSIWFTGFISLQTVCKVRYMWGEIAMRRLEKICYLWGLLLPFGSAIYLLITNQFNINSAGWCWINQYPFGCGISWYAQNQTVQTLCEYDPEHVSEELTDQSKLFFVHSGVALVLIIVVVCMILLFLTVRQQERRALRWSVTAQEGKYQKKVIQKAMLFIGTYLVMYLPIVALAFWSITLEGYAYWGDMIFNIMIPIQGFLNAFVYSNYAEKVLCWDCCTFGYQKPAERTAMFSAATDVTASNTNSKPFAMPSTSLDTGGKPQPTGIQEPLEQLREVGEPSDISQVLFGDETPGITPPDVEEEDLAFEDEPTEHELATAEEKEELSGPVESVPVGTTETAAQPTPDV